MNPKDINNGTRKQDATVQPKKKRGWWVTLALIAAAAVATGVLWGELQAVFCTRGPQVLIGKWLRPDGGYVLDIRGVAPDGRMDAVYFNPRPIHVAKAEASMKEQTVRLFIELRDVNYPGSTYTLAYEPKNDGLRGDYFQAAIQQHFDVVFERLTP